MPLDLDAYLHRIGYDGPVAADLATLTGIHEAHVGAIPFENLDVVRGLPVLLDEASLEAKLVRGGRGGYCFEHGTLLKAVLDRIGFTTEILTARVRFGARAIGARTHMLLKVETPDGLHLADVGFGGAGLLRPLPLLPDIVSHVPGAAYRLRHEGGLWVLEGDVGSDEFVDYYAFTLEPQYPVDITVANHFISTHADSPFRRTVTAQLTRPGHRAILRDRKLVHWRGAAQETVMLDGNAALLETLAGVFGLVFPPGTRFDMPAPG